MRKSLAILSILIGVLCVFTGISYANDNPQVCSGTHIDPGANVKSVTVTAPDGKLISGYCVKAGSLNQGNGPVYVTVDPPAKTVTITHPSGKDISHYTVTFVDKTVETTTTVEQTTTSTTVDDTTTTTVEQSTSTSTTSTTVSPTTTANGPTTTTTTDDETLIPPVVINNPKESSASHSTVEQLPATGAATVVGVTVGLALMAVGIAFIVGGALIARDSLSETEECSGLRLVR